MPETPNPYASPGDAGNSGSCTSDSVVEYEFTTHDWIEYICRQNDGIQAKAIRQRRRLLVIVAVATAALDVAWLRSGVSLIIAAPLLLIALWLVYRATVLPVQTRKRSERVLRHMLARKSNRAVLGRHRLELTAEGFHGENPGTTHFTTWWAVADIEITQDYLYLFTSSMHAHTIPARAFATPEHFHKFAQHALALWRPHQVAAGSGGEPETTSQKAAVL